MRLSNRSLILSLRYPDVLEMWCYHAIRYGQGRTNGAKTMALRRSAVDLFAGCGGVSLGLTQAGWDVLAACDNDPVAAATYRANHPDTDLIEGDIQDPGTVDRIVASVDGRRVDLVMICAPCQPFSSRNNDRGDDPRELLILKALSVVERLSPETVMFENVLGLKSKQFAPVLDALRLELLRLGYMFSDVAVHDAADFGVPQSRRRVIMLAARHQATLDVLEMHRFAEEHRTVKDAISDLFPLESGEKDPTDPLHAARTHRSVALERLRHIPQDGGSRASLPSHLWVECHRRASDSFPDSYGRLYWDRPAPTLTTGCTDITRGRYAHPNQDRAITLREAARLQTFPDSYLFHGNGGDIARQIGNAVPPTMVKLLADVLSVALQVVTDTMSGVPKAPSGRDLLGIVWRVGLKNAAPPMRPSDFRKRPLVVAGVRWSRRTHMERVRPRDPPILVAV